MPAVRGSDFSTREIASFWLLHAINSALAPLRHLLIAKRGHPEELFVELSRLAGALCTFSLDSQPRDLPVYDHQNLTDCFNQLDRHIRAHLETVLPTNCITIPLVAAGDCFYEGKVTDPRCLGNSRWVLGIRAGMPEGELMTQTPQLVKVCTPVFVRELVNRALPGMPLTHLPIPPAGYFHSRGNSVFWHQPQRTVLEPHAADPPGGGVCPQRVP